MAKQPKKEESRNLPKYLKSVMAIPVSKLSKSPMYLPGFLIDNPPDRENVSILSSISPESPDVKSVDLTKSPMYVSGYTVELDNPPSD